MTIAQEDVLNFPAKTIGGDAGQGEKKIGLSVYQHSLLTARVLEVLLKSFNGPSEDLPLSLMCLAAAHDIGKVNPCFLRKILDSVDEQSRAYILKKWQKTLEDFQTIEETPHPIISYATLKSLKVDRRIAALVAMHHGYPAPNSVLSDSAWMYGGPDWSDARVNLLERIFNEIGRQEYPGKNPDRCKQKVLSDIWLGLIVVSDWIASQREDPYPQGTEKELAEKLVQEAGFKNNKLNLGLTFKEIFGFDERPAQKKLSELYKGPGIYIFEAPTGYGKTEAALSIAYRALEQGDAKGIYFALPTQLTSTRLYERFVEYVNKITNIQEDSIKLIHGGTHFNKKKNYEAALLSGFLGKEGAPGESWFSSNRRAILAPFGVGTIDQALLSELPGIRFSCVRAAGLFGKVVILDEVHSYDAYTSSLLRNLLSRLIKIGAVVVILSATLTNKTKRALLNQKADFMAIDDAPICFTRKLASSEEVITESLPVRQIESRQVNVKLLENEKAREAFHEAIVRARRGEQVLWIENDVNSAQAYWEKFQAEGLECGLIHSRFRPVDREVLENKWAFLFGKKADKERGERGRVLIGTQILEQSLDLDADFLVTRLAPIDMLIQRIGRLWRHPGTKRPIECDKPAALILAGSELEEEKGENTYKAQFGKSGYVYSPPYILYRTLETLRERLQKGRSLILPNEVKTLLESTYAERTSEINPEIEEFRIQLNERRKKLEDFSKGVLSYSGCDDDTAPDPSTRYIDRPIYEIFIIESEEELTKAPSEKRDAMIWAERRLVKVSMNLSSLIRVHDMHKSSNQVINWMRRAKRFKHVYFLNSLISTDCGYSKEKGFYLKK